MTKPAETKLFTGSCPLSGVAGREVLAHVVFQAAEERVPYVALAGAGRRPERRREAAEARQRQHIVDEGASAPLQERALRRRGALALALAVL